jgi:hypothetical protein
MSRCGLLLRTLVAGLTVVLMGLCFASAQATPAKADEPFEVVKTGEFEGVIVAREKADDFMKAFSGIEEKETWTPGRTDVLKLEKGIESFLKKAAPKGSQDLWTKIPKYKRQYIGIMRKGRKVIFVNFFCDALNMNWKAAPVVVEDGGDCFFNVLYDPASAAFSDLRINGDA